MWQRAWDSPLLIFKKNLLSAKQSDPNDLNVLNDLIDWNDLNDPNDPNDPDLNDPNDWMTESFADD